MKRITVTLLLIILALATWNVEGRSSRRSTGRVIHYHFSGYMTDNKGDHPIELDFDASNKGLTNIVYKNVTLGGKIRMKCTRFSGIKRMRDGFGGYSYYLDYFTIVGKDGSNDFVMSMERVGNSPYEGTARVGSKRLTVMLYLD